MTDSVIVADVVSHESPVFAEFAFAWRTANATLTEPLPELGAIQSIDQLREPEPVCVALSPEN